MKKEKIEPDTKKRSPTSKKTGKKKRRDNIHTLEYEKVEDTEFLKEVAKDGSPLLENPLPLPKKHIKKNMEYGFEPQEDELKYDIVIPEYDDFDV
jgi:hypothetical protein